MDLVLISERWSSDDEKMDYDSSHFLLPSLSISSTPIALLLLNSRVSDPRFLEIIWKRCSAFRIIADGGAVRLYDGVLRFS